MGNNKSSSSVDYLEMYEVSGDIVGGIGFYVNSLKSLRNKIDGIKKASRNFKSLNNNSRTVITEKNIIECKAQVDDSDVGVLCENILLDIDECIDELSKMRNDANDCEYVADAIKKYTKKIEKGLTPSEKAKFWSGLGLSIDMYAAKKGSKVSISDNGADWDGVITFKRMPNGTYQVLKNGIVMGYTTAEGKKKYYAQVLKNSQVVKKELENRKSKKDENNTDLSDGSSVTIKGRKIPEKLLEWIKSEKKFSGKDIYLDSEEMYDVYEKGKIRVFVRDKNGKILGAYSYNKYQKNPSLVRIGYDMDSSMSVTKANAAGFSAGVVEGVFTFAEDTIDIGARVASGKARMVGADDFADKLNKFANNKYVAGAFDKTFYKSDAGKYIQNTSANPEIVREIGVRSGEAIASYGVGKAVKAASKAGSVESAVIENASSVEGAGESAAVVESSASESVSSVDNAISNSEGMKVAMDNRSAFTKEVKNVTDQLDIKYEGHIATNSGDEGVVFQNSSGVEKDVVSIKDTDKVTTMKKFQDANSKYLDKMTEMHNKVVNSSPPPATNSGGKGVVFRGVAKGMIKN